MQQWLRIAIEGGSVGINDVMYGLMSDSDKLSELTTLVGKLRYAVDSNEQALIREAETDIEMLSRHLEFDHKTERIVEGIKQGSDDARRLTILYVQRCYSIVARRLHHARQCGTADCGD